MIQAARENKIPLALFKVDIHKAFDTISWKFLEKVMMGLNFPKKWIDWINNCVLKGTSQIIIEGLLEKQLN